MILEYIIKTLAIKLRFWNCVSFDGFQALPLSVSINIGRGCNARFGRRVRSFPNTHFGVVDKGALIIGSHVFFNRNCIIACRDKVEIGDNCSFGPNVIIYDHDHRFDATGFYPNEYRTAPVIIGKRCWIGSGVTILKGTEIGDNCIIGAGSVVSGIIPANSLVTSSRELICKKLEDRTNGEEKTNKNE